MSENKKYELTETDVPMLFRLVSGDLIIGILDKDSTSSCGSDVVFVKHPAQIIPTQNGMMLSKWNLFSILDTTMIQGKAIIYADMPNKQIIDYYKDLLSPKEQTEEQEQTSDKVFH